MCDFQDPGAALAKKGSLWHQNPVNHTTMIQHYIRTGLRSISRHRLFSLINILGLAIGLTSFLVILLYVQDEMKYDDFHEDSGNVYRIVMDYPKESGGTAHLPGIFSRHLDDAVPQAQAISSFFRDLNPVIQYGDRRFAESRILLTDPAMFEILSLRLRSGDPATALEGPYKMVITPAMARKYFGDESPVGKTLTVDQEYRYEVTGILEPLPEQSHLDIEFLASLSSVREHNNLAHNHWGYKNSYFYTRLTPQADPDEAEKLINRLYHESRDESYDANTRLRLQPLEKIYLHSYNLEYDMARHSNIKYVTGFGALAVFLLVIVAFNYMNLSTARMSMREKEIGMRKIAGADRKKIIAQFMGESFVFTFVGALLALVLMHLALPWFNNISGKSLGLDIWNNLLPLKAMAIIMVLMTLFSGSYPAFLLSRVKPLAILGGAGQAYARAGDSRTAGHIRIRQALVFLQFAISVFLIIAAAVVYKQIQYIQNKNLGVDKEQVAIIKNPLDEQRNSRYEGFAGIAREYPGVKSVSSTFSAPPHLINNFTSLRMTGQPEEKATHIGLIAVGQGYFQTIGGEILMGRDFSGDHPSDASSGVILNETAARLMGKKHLLQLGEEAGERKAISHMLHQELTGFYDNQKRKVMGIARDIHFLSMKKKMPPLAFFMSKNYPPSNLEILVKMDTRNVPATVQKLKKAWQQVAPSWPFQMEFMDQRYDALYRSEQKIRDVVTVFTLLAIFLSLLGLFGLAAFSVDRRMREVGIRKAMGAQMNHIAALFSGEFFRWILVSNIIAWPAAYWVMNGWLHNYAYQTGLSLWIFLAASGAAIAVTGVILLYQTLRAGRANPAVILREE